ncbi:MAG: DNA polymerase I [Gemmatimonadaceae bacterium]
MDVELPKSPRLFLIDGYALIYRAFFALISRPLTTSRGENTSAAWGIANFLQRLLNDHKPEYLVWVHDSGLSFRHEQYPAYKATREKLTEELQSDFDTGMERVCALLSAYDIPILSLKGYEADDVIGTLVRQANERELNVVVVSGDKDFQQLVRPGVWLLNPGRGGPASVEEQWVGVENGAERLGVPPSYVTDYLALVGDSSDNVPGVKGIGDKTARDLVDQYGHLEAILAHAAELTKKRPREALLEHAENARLSKDLVTIRDNLDIMLDVEKLKVGEPDNSALSQLYVELEFHTLAKGAAVAIEAPRITDVARYQIIESVEEVERVVQLAREAGRIAIDTETIIDPGSPSKVDPLRSRLVSMSLAVAPGEAYYFPFTHTEPGCGQGDLLGTEEPPHASVKNLPALTSPEMKPLCDLIQDGSVHKTLQNAKHDMLVLRSEGVMLRGVTFDTMVASYVLDPGRRAHSLDVLALELLDHTMTTYEDVCGKGKSQIRFDQVSLDVARDYACEGADMTLRLQQHFEPQLDAHELTRLFEDVEMPLVGVLAGLEWNGVSIDGERFAMLKERFQREREQVQLEIYRAAGEEFNIGSNVQLREILFNRLNLPVVKRTPTGPSTDASVLQELAEQGHALPSLLMEYRELAKLENTYLDALPRLVNPRDGRIHTSFNQTVASTGRLSSSDPNLQNIPIRRELGRDIRRGFIPRVGWSLLAADYSQIELRLLAHLSCDPNFVQAFIAGGDIHRQTAAIIFDTPLEAVTSEMRGRAKTINFATIYGQGPHALSRQLGIAHAEAKDFIAKYFERFGGVKRYLDSMVEFAREHGYVQTIFGRRRYIPELRERNFNMRAFGERTAANSPIQGSAADLIKIAMIRIDDALRDLGLESKMLLQVHDELVFEVAPGELDRLREMAVYQMEHAAELSVPLVVDVGVGENWLDTKI